MMVSVILRVHMMIRCDQILNALVSDYIRIGNQSFKKLEVHRFLVLKGFYIQWLNVNNPNAQKYKIINLRE